VCTLPTEINHLLVGVCTLLAEIEHFLVLWKNQAGIVQEQNTNINRGIQAIYCAEYRNTTTVSTALKFTKISHYNKGSNNGTKWQDEH
jgi:hypothetical protein